MGLERCLQSSRSFTGLEAFSAKKSRGEGWWKRDVEGEGKGEEINAHLVKRRSGWRKVRGRSSERPWPRSEREREGLSSLPPKAIEWIEIDKLPRIVQRSGPNGPADGPLPHISFWSHCKMFGLFLNTYTSNEPRNKTPPIYRH